MKDTSKFELLPNFISNNNRKKSVLYIGEKGTSGYASAAKGHVYSLIKNKITVQYLEFETNNSCKDLPPESFLIPSKKIILSNPTDIIIHSIPTGWDQLLSGSKANYSNNNTTKIGRTVWEFNKLPSEWVNAINNSKVNIVSVPTELNKQIFIDNGVTKQIVVDSHIFIDCEYQLCSLNNLFAKSILFSKKELNGKHLEPLYKFYCISQFISRKGIEDAIEAFCKAFTSNDKVLFLLKGFRKNYSTEEQIEVTKFLQTISDRYDHAPILYIKDPLTFDEIQSLHHHGDCYLSLTKAEGFGLGIFDAFNYKKDIIVTGYGGHTEFLPVGFEGYVNYKLIPVHDISTDVHVDKDCVWAHPDIEHAVTLLKQNYKLNYKDDLYYLNKYKKVSDGNVSNLTINYVGDYGEMMISPINNNNTGKINLINQTSFYSHRSGWNYVINNLLDLHNPEGVIFDGFLENAFCWRKSYCLTEQIIPYKQPWVGFLHNPPNMPMWFSDNNANPQLMINDKPFKDSLKYCRGLFVLSNYYKRFLQYYLPNLPIDVLYHPTEIPQNQFNFNKFYNNKEKKIVNIGWWLRKLNSIFLLHAPNYTKIRLLPNNKCKETVLRLTKFEKSLFNIKLNDSQENSVTYVDHLENTQYDELLSQNIVFIDLYDTSANNAVIECIARGTPLLINRHPATIEYLGEDYPFYFDSYDEAAIKLKNMDLIKQTHEYLMTYELRKQIKIEYFKEQLINSNIYKKL
jgi:glycosyltransferase involved in cell wall biosynthesis